MKLSSSRKFPPNNIDIGGIYLVNDSTGWNRIRVDGIDSFNSEFKCFFIDRGQRKVLQRSKMFFCPSEFLALPAQAIRFSIDGLEEYTEHPYAADILTEYFKHDGLKKFVVRSCDANAQTQLAIIPAEFFAIVDGKAISCAEELLNAITDATPKPSFKKNVPVSSRVSHVSDSGIVYFQLDHRSLRYINDSIQMLKDCFHLTKYDFSSADAVLVYDEMEMRLFRAKITDVLNKKKDRFTCLYIDYGYIRSVPSSHIFNLKMTSVALYTFPNQATPARLKALTEFDDYTLDRLRGIFGGRAKIIAKPIECTGLVATVEVFKREYPSGHMVCVNDWILMEAEMRK